MILESIITCPRCGTARTETMPTDACQLFLAGAKIIWWATERAWGKFS